MLAPGAGAKGADEAQQFLQHSALSVKGAQGLALLGGHPVIQTLTAPFLENAVADERLPVC